MSLKMRIKVGENIYISPNFIFSCDNGLFIGQIIRDNDYSFCINKDDIMNIEILYSSKKIETYSEIEDSLIKLIKRL